MYNVLILFLPHTLNNPCLYLAAEYQLCNKSLLDNRLLIKWTSAKTLRTTNRRGGSEESQTLSLSSVFALQTWLGPDTMDAVFCREPPPRAEG